MSFTYIIHGTGTELDPYLIENAEGLKELFASTEDLTEAYFKQTADIVINDPTDYDSWLTQAPSYIQPAKPAAGGIGYYDGDNHSITGLFYNTFSRDFISCLLFYYVKYKISNLSIKKSLMKQITGGYDPKLVSSLLTSECPCIENVKSEAQYYLDDQGGLNLSASEKILAVFNVNVYNGLLYRSTAESFHATNCLYTGNVHFKGSALSFSLFDLYTSSDSTGIYASKCGNEGVLTLESVKAYSGSSSLELCGIVRSTVDQKDCDISECYNKMNFIVDGSEVVSERCNLNICGIAK